MLGGCVYVCVLDVWMSVYALFWHAFCLLYQCRGSACHMSYRYGYFRPHVRLFDPGWHGLQVKGEEDENTGDNGNDPLGVLARYVLDFAAAAPCTVLLYFGWWESYSLHKCNDRNHSLL